MTRSVEERSNECVQHTVSCSLVLLRPLGYLLILICSILFVSYYVITMLGGIHPCILSVYSILVFLFYLHWYGTVRLIPTFLLHLPFHRLLYTVSHELGSCYIQHDEAEKGEKRRGEDYNDWVAKLFRITV